MLLPTTGTQNVITAGECSLHDHRQAPNQLHARRFRIPRSARPAGTDRDEPPHDQRAL